MSLADFPAILAAVVDAVPSDKLRIRASNGRFAVVEHVWHLADLEEEGYGTRIIRLLAEDNPVLPDFRGDVLAEQRQYLTQDVAPALQRFARTREMNAMLLASLKDDQRARRGRQEGVGEITLSRVEEMMRIHDGEHAADLRELLAELGIDEPGALRAFR